MWRRIPCAFARVGLLLAVIFALTLAVGPQLSIYFMTRTLAARYPALNVAPRPLTDTSISQNPGTAVSYLGYTFEVPWQDSIKKENVVDHFVAVRFENGRAMMLVVPENRSGLLNEVVDDEKLKVTYLRPLFGELLRKPGYDQYFALLNTTPQSIRAFGPRTDAARGQALLMLKAMAFPANLQSGVFSFDFPDMRGFQIGDPQKSQRVDLEIFGAEGVHAEMTLLTDAKRGAPLSQPQINRTLASFRAVHGAKPNAERHQSLQ